MPGQGRLGDKASVPLDAHGCPACPHPAIGPAIQGSPDVNVNGRPALRVDDPGIHAACCGTNTWTATRGSITVFINGKGAHRMGDQNRHCGGMGQLIEGSPNVIVGEDSAAGGGAAGGGGGASGGASGAGAGGGAGSGSGVGGAAGGGREAQMGAGADRGGGDGAGGTTGGGEGPTAGGAGGGSETSATETPVAEDELAIVVVSARGRPLANVALDLTLPDGTRRRELTGDDGSYVRGGIATPGKAHVVLVDFDTVDDERPAPATPGARLYERGGVQAEVGTRMTLEVPPHALRARLIGMLFDTDKAFLLPQAMAGIRELARFYAQHPELAVLVNGHADRSGADDYNVALSAERARSIAAFLTDAVDDWLPWYSAPQASKRWGVREDQMMLSVIADGGAAYYAGPIDGQSFGATHDAVARYQTSRGLAVDGIAGPETRRSLITDYMAQDGTSLPPGTPIATHGCGEHHPAVATADGVGAASNRRVELFLFEPAVEPAPVEPCAAPGCREYAVWVRRSISTVDLDVPPGALAVAVVDERGAPVAGASVHLSGPVTDDGIATTGAIAFDTLIPGDYAVLARADGFETGNAAAVVAPDSAASATVVLRALVELFDARWSAGDEDALSLRLRDARGRPVAGATVTVEVAGQTRLAAADDQGHATIALPAGARQVVVRYAAPGPVVQTLELAPPPASSTAGAELRLRALGYLAPPDDDLGYATFSFQVDRGLPATGELDGATQAALTEVYGS